jgi:hypothetical protein
VIVQLLLTLIIEVTPAPGWSEPVISIEVGGGSQRKDLIVTDDNHIHQIWNHYLNETRIGYNIVLPDGTVLLEDTLLSRDEFSSHPSASYAPDSGFIGFWREGTSKWYSVKDHEGNTITPATYYSSEGYTSWFRVDSSLDSLGRIHMVWDSGPAVCYSILDPGVGEVWRDTVPDSRQQSLVLVDGSRVHIKFNGPDQWADYIQYDLDGNVTVPTVSLVENVIGATNWCSMEVDTFGNVYFLLHENPDGEPRRFTLYKINGATGEIMIDGKIIYEAPASISINDPIILARPSGNEFYVMWRETDSTGFYRLIKFAVIDTNGDFVVEPYIAYDYTDEDPEDLRNLAATVNSQGDVFIVYSEGDPAIPGYWIRLGWFDHTYLGIEDDSTVTETSSSSVLVPSVNPFSGSVTIAVDGDDVSASLRIYDLSGRIVDELLPSEEGTYIWNGTSQDGNELPSGNYIVRSDNTDIASVILTKNAID